MTTNHDSPSPESPTPESSVSDNATQETAPISGEPPADTASESETASTQKLAQPEPAFGWTAYAEQINGRFAMIGFVALLILEAVTGQDFLTWLGLR